MCRTGRSDATHQNCIMIDDNGTLVMQSDSVVHVSLALSFYQMIQLRRIVNSAALKTLIRRIQQDDITSFYAFLSSALILKFRRFFSHIDKQINLIS